MSENEQKKLADNSSDSREMGFLDHLGELRGRLLIVSATVLILACFSFSYSQHVFALLSQPFYDAFPNDILIGTGPAEAFMIRIKVALFCGALFSSPMIFLQIWLFIAPGLYDHEKKMAIPFILSTTLLFLIGAAFCFYVVLPFAFEFFKSQYQEIGIRPTIRITEHLGLVLKAILGFGVVFEMPILAFLLGRLGVITAEFLKDGFRYAVVGIFLISAMLTPPDVLTQFLMAGPLIVLYGISILVVQLTGKREEQSSIAE